MLSSIDTKPYTSVMQGRAKCESGRVRIATATRRFELLQHTVVCPVLWWQTLAGRGYHVRVSYGVEQHRGQQVASTLQPTTCDMLMYHKEPKCFEPPPQYLSRVHILVNERPKLGLCWGLPDGESRWQLWRRLLIRGDVNNV